MSPCWILKTLVLWIPHLRDSLWNETEEPTNTNWMDQTLNTQTIKGLKTRLFLVLASLTTYPDDALCVFYDASLNIACRAPSSEDGPRANFAAFVEWTLGRHGSPFTRLPAGSTVAPSSLLSAVAHLSTGSAGFPRPSGSALVWRRPSCASGLHSSGCASSLRPSGSVRLLHPLGSSSVLWRSGSTAAIWIPISTSVAGAICSALVPWILLVALALRLSVSASGSSSTCSAAVGRPPGVGGHPSSMAPPSVGSTVGRCYGCGLGPAVLLLLRVPPVSSLAPPSFVAPLVSVCQPPPGCPSSSWAASQVPTLPGGGVMSGLWTCLCVFCSLWPSFSLMLVV